MLVYGELRTGKTWLASTAIELGLNCVWVVARVAEVDTLAAQGKNAEVIVLEKPKDFIDVVQVLRDKPPDLVVVDNLTDIQNIGLDTLAGDPANRISDVLAGGRLLEIQDYGAIDAIINWLVNPILELPCHKIVITLADVTDDLRTREPKYVPALVGRQKRTLGSKFSIIAYTFLYQEGAKVHYCVSTLQNVHFTAGDRYGLNRTWAPGHFGDFLKALKGEPLKPPTELEKRIDNIIPTWPIKPPVKVEPKRTR